MLYIVYALPILEGCTLAHLPPNPHEYLPLRNGV